MRANFADQRILRATNATLSWQAVDGDGEPVDPGAVTATVTNSAGDDLLVDATASGTSTNPRTVTFDDSLNTELDLLTVAWSGDPDGTTLVDVVGGYFFSVTEARELDPSLADTTNYPTEDILAARREVETTFEHIVGFAMVPRYRKVTESGSGGRVLIVEDPYIRTVRSARIYTDTANSTELSAPELAALTFEPESAELHRTSGWPCGVGNVVVEYEHGLDGLPANLKRHAVTYLRHLLNQNRSGIPDRAERYQPVEGGTYFLSMPAADKTGIPEVDAALYRVRDGAVGADGKFFGVA